MGFEGNEIPLYKKGTLLHVNIGSRWVTLG